MIAIAAVKACVGERVIYFPWSDDPSCPGRFEDVFNADPNLIPASGPASNATVLETHGWEPLTIYEQLRAALRLTLSLEEFCRNFVLELRSLKFRSGILDAVRDWRVQCNETLLGVHIRRTDRTAHHKGQFQAFLMGKQGLNRELPVYLSAMYGLCPASFMSAYENVALVRSMRRFGKERNDLRYAVFTDNRREALGFEKAAFRYGVAYVTEEGAVRSSKRAENRFDQGLRETSLRNAVIDMLRLSECDAIAQGNRASTFSIVASIIGAKPIITPGPLYPFWRVIKDANGCAANDPGLIG